MKEMKNTFLRLRVRESYMDLEIPNSHKMKSIVVSKINLLCIYIITKALIFFIYYLIFGETQVGKININCFGGIGSRGGGGERNGGEREREREREKLGVFRFIFIHWFSESM